MTEHWTPQGCPILENQRHGYKHVHSAACGASPQQLALAQLRTARQIHRDEPVRIRIRAWIAWWLRDRWT